MMSDANGQALPADLLASWPEWLRDDAGDPPGVVLSSRVRIARNLADHPFAPVGDTEARGRVVEACREALMDNLLPEPLHWIDLRGASALARRLLLERRLISRNLASGKWSGGKGRNGHSQPRAVAVGGDGQRLSIMVNEEDHLRIQVVRRGRGLGPALDAVDAIDDAIEERLRYAYSPRFGYLTACPTNVGTGLRLSVMLHVPGLQLTGEIEKVCRAAEDMSLAMRGFYGEGSNAMGDFYQISNQTTLGKSERVLLHELECEILPSVLAYERSAREQLLHKRRRRLEDQVHRALATLQSARLLTNEEAMNHLSKARLGVATGLLSAPSMRTLNRLTLLVQPGHLQYHVGRELGQEARRGARADLVREALAGVD